MDDLDLDPETVPVKPAAVPQANDVESVLDVVAALSEDMGASEISGATGLPWRQAHYCAAAGEILGLVERTGDGRWRRTSLGGDLAAERRWEQTAALIADLAFIRSYREGGDDALRAEWADGLSESTLKRRLSCVRSWARYCATPPSGAPRRGGALGGLQGTLEPIRISAHRSTEHRTEGQGGQDMKTEVIDIDPKFAAELLASSTGNRPIPDSAVRGIMKTILNDEWRLTHQGIAIDVNGHLVDGHHRLTAIVRTGRTVPMLVAYDVAPESFAVLDTGKKRSGGDVLAIAGHSGGKDLAAAVRLLHIYENGLPSGGSTSQMANSDVLSKLEASPGIEDALGRAHALRRSCGMAPAAGTVGVYLTERENPHLDQAPWFDGVIGGVGLPAGDARLAFRNAMFHLRSSASVRRGDSPTQLAWYLKAWNAWATGRAVRSLRIGRGEPNPMPVRVGTPLPADAPSGLAGPVMTTASARLRSARVAAGLKQWQLAQLAGFTHQANISAYETGQEPLGEAMLERLLAVIDKAKADGAASATPGRNAA